MFHRKYGYSLGKSLGVRVMHIGCGHVVIIRRGGSGSRVLDDASRISIDYNHESSLYEFVTWAKIVPSDR